MPFPLAIRSQHQLPDDLYPVVLRAGSALPVALYAGDGAVRDVAASSLVVRTQHNGHVREAASVRRGGVDVRVTDERVILVGARPTPDSILVGHVLLDWVVAVGGSTGRGLFRGDALRLVLQMDSGDYQVLTLTLDGDVDVHELAQDIARRTARRWLARESSSPLVTRWRALADAPRLTAEHGAFALHWTPSHTRVVTQVCSLERAGVPA